MSIERNSQLEEALRSYEMIRDDLYKELKIAYVQERIRNKILNLKSNKVEFLFFEAIEECSSEQSIGNLLSEDVEEKVEEQEEREESVQEDKKILKDHSRKNKLSDFLDLEAEYSGDDAEEDSQDEDLHEIIDNTVDNSINLDHFIRERFEQDEKALTDLKRRFLKPKKKLEVQSDLDIMDIESNDEFPEIKELEFEMEMKVEDYIPTNGNIDVQSANLNKKIKIENRKVFDNKEMTVERLCKPENKKTTGFVEKEK